MIGSHQLMRAIALEVIYKFGQGMTRRDVQIDYIEASVYEVCECAKFAIEDAYEADQA
jgi:hypothetical protein